MRICDHDHARTNEVTTIYTNEVTTVRTNEVTTVRTNEVTTELFVTKMVTRRG